MLFVGAYYLRSAGSICQIFFLQLLKKEVFFENSACEVCLFVIVKKLLSTLQGMEVVFTERGYFPSDNEGCNMLGKK